MDDARDWRFKWSMNGTDNPTHRYSPSNRIMRIMRIIARIIVVIALVTAGGQSMAQEVDSSGYWFANAEATFFRYLRADGVRVGTGSDESGSFAFEAAPRFTVGRVTPSGCGLRVRYWDFEAFTGVEDVAEGDGIGVDTYTLDVELFQEAQLTQTMTMECFFGIRHNGFTERMLDSPGQFDQDIRSHDFNGLGAIIGAEFRWDFFWGEPFARIRGVALQGDLFVINDDDAGGGIRAPLEHRQARDVLPTVIEIAIGYEYGHEISFGRRVFVQFAYERQIWFDYSHSLVSDLDFPFIFEQFGAPSSVGFGGMVLSAGMEW